MVVSSPQVSSLPGDDIRIRRLRILYRSLTRPLVTGGLADRVLGNLTKMERAAVAAALQADHSATSDTLLADLERDLAAERERVVQMDVSDSAGRLRHLDQQLAVVRAQLDWRKVVGR